MEAPLTRRGFTAQLLGGMVALLPGGGWRRSSRTGILGGPHPEPRPGITAAKVLTRDQLGTEELFTLFDQVREIPQIVDGIRCQCGCAQLPGYYSLLSCYEGDGMARSCPVCQGQARLAYRLHKAGRTLEQIRAGIDARFG